MTNVLTLSTGGTIAMTDRADHPFYSGEELYSGVSKPMGFKFGFRAYNNLMDSTNLQHEDRATIADILRLEYAKYDAFVILHGSDTLDLTLAYLSVAFGNTLQKPLFVIASARRHDEFSSDAKQQLRDVMFMVRLFIERGYVGCYTISAGRLLEGSRVCKRLGPGVDIFDTPGLKSLIHVHARNHDDSLRCYDEDIAKRGLSALPLKLAREVVTLEVSADASPFSLMALTSTHAVKGAILISKGEGNIPDRTFKTWSDDHPRSWIDVIGDATGRGIPIGIRSPFEGAEFDMERYDLGRKALAAGAISLSGLTPAMADIKFRHAVARFKGEVGHIRKYLDEDPIGKLPTTKQAAA